MGKAKQIELHDGELIPILYEDRSVLAIDKPRGWLLAPDSWQNTVRNLQLALTSSIQSGAFWAKSRNLKFLRFIHRLDADTSGVLLLARNPRVISAYGALFESRRMHKTYLAVVTGRDLKREWTCRQKLAPNPARKGTMKVDPHSGKDAETQFRTLDTRGDLSLVEVRPLTGRTHQIRVHLAVSGCPVVGDPIYGRDAVSAEHLALRAVSLSFPDPFTHRRIHIQAPTEQFLTEYGFDLESSLNGNPNPNS